LFLWLCLAQLFFLRPFFAQLRCAVVFDFTALLRALNRFCVSPRGAFVLPALKTRLNSLQNGGCFMFTIYPKNVIFNHTQVKKWGVLHIHIVPYLSRRKSDSKKN
jgi:hypothetical protein